MAVEDTGHSCEDELLSCVSVMVLTYAKSMLFSPFPVCEGTWEEKPLYRSTDIEAKKSCSAFSCLGFL